MSVTRSIHRSRKTDPKLASLEDFDIAEIAKSVGCNVLQSSTVDEYGKVWTVVELDTHDNPTAIRFLSKAAKYDAREPDIRALASELRRKNPQNDAAFASAVQAYVKNRVVYIVEEDEEFQSALLTLHARTGDCDKQARAVAAICIAGGLKAQVKGVENGRGEIVHVCAQALVGGVWTWLETTVDAEYGEEPIAAGVRLGILSGTVRG